MVSDCLSNAKSDESWVNRRSEESDDNSESSENQELQLLKWGWEDEENEALQELLELQEFAHTVEATLKKGCRGGIKGTLGPASASQKPTWTQEVGPEEARMQPAPIGHKGTCSRPARNPQPQRQHKQGE